MSYIVKCFVFFIIIFDIYFIMYCNESIICFVFFVRLYFVESISRVFVLYFYKDWRCFDFYYYII